MQSIVPNKSLWSGKWKPRASFPVQGTEEQHTGVLSNSNIWVLLKMQQPQTGDSSPESCVSHPAGLWRKSSGSEAQPLCLLFASLYIFSHRRTLSSSVLFPVATVCTLILSPRGSYYLVFILFWGWQMDPGNSLNTMILGPKQHGGACWESHFWGGGRRI